MKEEFKDRFQLLRKEEQLTTTEVATAFDKSESAIRMWESGRSKPDADTIIKLAQQFNVSTDYLLGLSDIRTAKVNFSKNRLGFREGSVKSVNDLRYKTMKSKQNGEDTRTYLDVLESFLSTKSLSRFMLFLGKVTDPSISKWPDIPYSPSDPDLGKRPAKQAYTDAIHLTLDRIVTEMTDNEKKE